MGLRLYILALLLIFSTVNGRFNIDPLNFFHDNDLNDFNNFIDRVNAPINKLPTLRYVLVVTRHGSRSPLFTYPTDPYPFTSLKYWPDGFGQLTKYGKHQMFNVGRELRKRYNGFLSPYYSRNDTYVISEYYDRDFMSAATLLAGLYPPVGFQVWNKAIPWQPIPIFESRFDIGDLANGSRSLCPRFYEANNEAVGKLNMDSPKYADLLKYLSDNTGKTISALTDVYPIYDTLSIQAENGFKLPAWAKKVYDVLESISTRVIQVMIAGSDEQKRLQSGPLLQLISDQLNTKASGKMDPDRKLYINAAHDVTVLAILNGIGINPPLQAGTGAHVVFELHNDSTGYIVEVVYYKDGETTHPEMLNMPDCPNPCSLDGFNSAIRKYIPGNWNDECMKTST